MLDSNSWSVTLRESRSGNLRKITVAREHHCLMRKRGSSVGMGTTGRRWCTGGSFGELQQRQRFSHSQYMLGTPSAEPVAEFVRGLVRRSVSFSRDRTSPLVFR